MVFLQNTTQRGYDKMKQTTKRISALMLVIAMLISLLPATLAYSQVGNGSQGQDVKTMQTMLNTVMNAGLTADGICGPKSVEAIKNFQKAYGLAADGICGKNTWAKLEAEYNARIQASSSTQSSSQASPPSGSSYATIRNGSQGSDVKTMQRMLNQVMGAGLTVDGICGAKTVAAIKNFQKANGLSVDGVCGPKTWEKLESAYYSNVEKQNACKSHKYNSANGDRCINCDYVYSPAFTSINKTYQAAKGSVAVRDNYYANSSKIVRHLAKGEKVTIAASFRNSVGNLWYKTSDGYYIFSDNLTEAQSVTAYGDTGVVTFSKSRDGGTYLTKNFKVSEFACKDGSDEIPIDMELVGYLQQIRDHFGAAVTINSGYRSPSHNAKIGGATSSYHLQGKAADIVVSGRTPREVAQYAASIGVRGIELNERYGYVHIDTRPTKYWFVPTWSNGKIVGYKQVSNFN